LICNNNNHSIYCPNYKNSLALALKGASEVNNQSKQQLKFHKREIDILSKVIEIGRFYITKNKDQFQQPKDLLEDINSAMSILEARKNNKKIYVLKK